MGDRIRKVLWAMLLIAVIAPVFIVYFLVTEMMMYQNDLEENRWLDTFQFVFGVLLIMGLWGLLETLKERYMG
jgi:hypothetical protein